MKSIITIIVTVFFGVHAYSQESETEFDKNWLVILSGFKTESEAKVQSAKYSVENYILNSAEYDNLNPGWFINCIPFSTKQEADIHSKSLKAEGISNYIKYAGTYKAYPDYLKDNHFIVVNNKYIILNETIRREDIGEIVGCDQSQTYVAYASVPSEHIPDYYNYFLNKNMLVYNSEGKQMTAKVTGFYAAFISNPYWGYATQWAQNNASEIEIASQIINNADLELVAVLDIDENFKGAICHLEGETSFGSFKKIKNAPLEIKAISKLENHTKYKENMSKLMLSLEEDAANGYEREMQLFQTMQTYIAGSNSYVLINVSFGDYCDNMKNGFYYSSLSALWNENLNTLELIDIMEHQNYFPIISSNNEELIGLVEHLYGGATTYFKTTDWEEVQSKRIPEYECD